jgi:uncharacterized membrane protein
MTRDSTFSIKEALEFGWSRTRANLNPLLILGGIAAILAGLQRGLSPQDVFLVLAIQLMQVALTLIWIRVALMIHDGADLDWSKSLDFLDGYLPFLLTVTLTALVVVAGFALLIVPGVIWGLRYSFSSFVAVDRNLDPVAALRESARLTYGRKWHLLEFALAMIGVNILGALALGVGLLISVPTTWIASAFVFRKLQAGTEKIDHSETPLGHATPA